MGQERKVLPEVTWGEGLGLGGHSQGPFCLTRSDLISHLKGHDGNRCHISTGGQRWHSVRCANPVCRARLEAEAGRESPVFPQRLQICFPLRRAILERGQMLQEPLINDGIAMSCKRLQWRIQGQERALPIGSRSSRRPSSHEFVTLGAVPDAESGTGFGGTGFGGTWSLVRRDVPCACTPTCANCKLCAGSRTGGRGGRGAAEGSHAS